jgi:hypothetical protein
MPINAFALPSIFRKKLAFKMIVGFELMNYSMKISFLFGLFGLILLS